MSEGSLTLLEDGRSHVLPATREAGRTFVPAAALEAALGWHLEPQGLCRGDVCVPTAGRDDLTRASEVDLAAFAELLGLPMAEDVAEGVVSLGCEARGQAEALATGMAPDFTLPDFEGSDHTLSAFRGKKVLLVAYASW